MDDISQEVKRLEDETIRLRRDFHRHPELGLQEKRTGQIVADYLEACGLEVKRLNVTGVSALLRGSSPGPTVLLRADMDALPITEEVESPFTSVNKGIMHACGHDAHTAMLLVAAKILAKHKASLHGTIKFVFEPNEENSGALQMIEEGVLNDPAVDACFGIHVWSPLQAGKVGVKAGPIMAGMKHFALTIHGRGGHTATPHSAIDPVLPAAAIIQAVQSIQSRELDALQEPAVIMFGSIAGGTADNVIPDRVTLRGTIRYLYEGDDDSDSSPLARFRRIVDGMCAAHRTTSTLEITFGHPTLVNDPALVDLLTSEIIPALEVPLDIEPLQSLAGEDFSEFASRVPSVFYFLGAGKAAEVSFPHHHPRFEIEESVLKYGVELHVRAALQFLRR